jgi:S1-C subfamily serine protease
LGVEYQTVTPEVAQEHDLGINRGAFIVRVVEGSPAREAGLLAGDVILEVDGKQVDSRATLTDHLLAYSPGDTVELTILRRGKQTDAVVTLGVAPPQGP